MKSESDVKKIVKKVLTATPKCYWFMPPANGFGRSGIPDFVGWVNGHAFVVETKFGANDCTPNQQRELVAARQCGGEAWIVRDTTIDVWISEFQGWAALCS